MPLLGSLVLGLFTQLLGAFTLALGRKAAVIAAAIAAVSTATLALTATLAALVSALIPALPSGLALAAWLFLPSNIVACVAAVVVIDSTCTLYAWYRHDVIMTAKIAGS